MVGYTTSSTIVESEQGLDLDIAKNRVFKIANEGKTDGVAQTPVGFKLVPCYSQLLLAHAVWATRYHEDELFPAGRYTMQSRGREGLASMIAKKSAEGDGCSSVRNQDIAVWHTFGSTHNPRIEDWPAMPSEKMVVGLSPSTVSSVIPPWTWPYPRRTKNQSVSVDGAQAESCFHDGKR